MRISGVGSGWIKGETVEGSATDGARNNTVTVKSSVSLLPCAILPMYSTKMVLLWIVALCWEFVHVVSKSGHLLRSPSLSPHPRLMPCCKLSLLRFQSPLFSYLDIEKGETKQR